MYQAMVIFQERNARRVGLTLIGNGGTNIVGTVYAPSSPFSLTGNGCANIGPQFICDTMSLTGNGNFTLGWAGNQPPPGKDIRLVE